MSLLIFGVAWGDSDVIVESVNMIVKGLVKEVKLTSLALTTVCFFSPLYFLSFLCNFVSMLMSIDIVSEFKQEL